MTWDKNIFIWIIIYNKYMFRCLTNTENFNIKVNKICQLSHERDFTIKATPL